MLLRICLLGSQLDQNNLRPVVETKGKETVSNTPADQHIGISICKDPCVVFRKQPLMRCHKTTDKRQTELTTVGMTGEHQREWYRR